MNIKGLLLGSAAAFVAVSGARAADAVVIAEPEPMEYVRVCDAYGVGFYYIPGTETCLKVSGYMRYDIGIGRNGNLDVVDKKDLAERILYDDTFTSDYRSWRSERPRGRDYVTDDGFDREGFRADRAAWRDRRPEYDAPGVGTNDTYFKRARFALRVDARSETELGTLRAYAQVNFNYDSTDYAGSYIPSRFLRWHGAESLSGDITSNSNYVVLEHGYIELGGFRAGVTDSYFSTFTGYSSGVANDGIIPYGPFQTHQISYTFNGGNGFTAGVALETGGGWDSDRTAELYAIDSYVPHVVGGVGYTAGWGGLSGVVGYDSNYEEFAVKGRVDINATPGLSFFAMAGWQSDDNKPNYYAQWGGDWAMWLGGAWQFNEKTTLNVEIGYDDAENFSTVVGLDYELVNNFVIKPEVIYVDNFNSNVEVDDKWGGFLRLQANFGG